MNIKITNVLEPRNHISILELSEHIFKYFLYSNVAPFIFSAF